MMSSTGMIITLIVIIFVSIFVVSIANIREQRRRAKNQKLNSLRRKINWLEGLVTELEPLLEQPSVIALINDLIIDEISRAKRINPNIINFNASYQAAIARAESLEDQHSSDHLDRLKESDSQIARALKSLEDAAVLVKKGLADNKITQEQMELYLRQLNWSHLMVSVISNIGQGHKAARRKNALSAKAFYKKAHQLLLGSTLADQRRQEFIKQIAEVIGAERTTISPELMPETYLNP